MKRLFVDGHQDSAPALLPCATRERWQPVRGGLLNIYLYDYEEFRYENGHLILRGNNGTGKSRVMALQLPFLFDGRLGSSRVEPDADPSKRMEWNLLLGRYNERLGYTWIEFGRRCAAEQDGARCNGATPPLTNGSNGLASLHAESQQFVTLGCGLSATRGSGMREPWFFMTDQRIGKELYLQSDAGHPLSKSGLAEAIGERGTIFTTAKDYRQAVDDKLFGLGRQRYEAMVELLIQLRKPQLSRQLDERMLAGVLGESLPPPREQMIADVAESFRALESDRMELNRFRLAGDGVESFLKTYRRYACIAARRRAANVRQSHCKYEAALKELRQVEREHAAAAAQLAAAAESERRLEIQAEAVDIQITALQADPKMRSAEAIGQAVTDEQQARVDLDTAQDSLRIVTDRLTQRRTACEAVQQQAEIQFKQTLDLWRRSSQLALVSGLKTPHESAGSSLMLKWDQADDAADGDRQSLRRQLDLGIASRAKSVDQLTKRNNELALAELGLARASQDRDDAQHRVQCAIETQRSAEEHRRRVVSDFLDAYDMWLREAADLSMPSTDELAMAVDDWSRQVEEQNPVIKAAHAAELIACQGFNAERGRWDQRLDQLEVEQAQTRQLAEQLAQGFHESPSPPFRTDETARETRSGAPFWSLVDFTPSCPPAQRAEIEAALEAAGFLNAWVLPDGSVLTADFADVLLTPGGSTAEIVGRSLTEVLVPDADQFRQHGEVPEDVIVGILCRIGYGEQATSTWVAPRGRWQNGLLRGQCQKDAAQYIGRAAREEHRVRRLAEIRADVRRSVEQCEQIRRQRQLIDGRMEAVAGLIMSIPAEAPMRAAANELLFVEKSLAERRQELTEAERIVADHRVKTSSLRESRDRDATDLALFEWKERLDELRRIIAEYQRLLAEFWPSMEYFDSLKAQYAASAASVREAQHDMQLGEEQQHDRQTRHARVAQRLKTLRETMGIDADSILHELAEADAARRKILADLKAAQLHETNAGLALARIEERIKSKQEAVLSETDVRQQSCAAFQRLCELGVLAIAMGDAYEDDTVAWSVSRTVDVARQAESVLSHISADNDSWDRAQESVTATIQELNMALSQHAFTSTLSTSDNLYCVAVPYQGRDCSVHELRDLLAEEVRQRQLVLDEREREIIENHLIGEVAAQLHEQIQEAHGLIERMNAELQKRPMSTGMTLKFDWSPDENLSPGIIEMCRKLLGSTGTWSPSERIAIGRYLQDHIKAVRASHDAGTWHEHLAEALDYRQWHRFWVLRKQDSGWKRLTKRTHGTGSGGEKAVALTIPQFAAAAAHYSSARDDAPRMILLDEAFVGIDPDMRGKCMELIDVFDLDFLMTSENEWGCYAGLPGVAIYQLSTRSGFDAVFLTRWIWNGKQRLKDDSLLPSATRNSN